MPRSDLRGGAVLVDHLDFGRGLSLARASISGTGPRLQFSGGLSLLDTGLTIIAGGLTVTAGAVTLTPNTTITGTLTQTGIATFAAIPVFSLGATITTGGLTVSDGASAMTDNALATTAPLALKNATATTSDVLGLSLASDDAANGVNADKLYIDFILDNDAQAQTIFARLTGEATDVATEAGAMLIELRAADTAAAERFRFASQGDLTMTCDARATPTAWSLKTLTGTFPNAAATSVVGTTQLPIGLIFGVNMDITTAYETADSLTVGVSGGDIDAWGTGISIALGTTTSAADYTATPILVTSATDVILGDLGLNANVTAGAATYQIYYMELPAMVV